jgi:cation:H+ antiporter
MSLVDVLLYIAAFLLIWFGSGLTVKSIEAIAHRLRMNTFIVSFVILGLFTSLPETFLAINSTISEQPEVSAGNLLGGIIILFLLLIPLIAITGKGAKIIKDISKIRLFVSLIVIALPAVLLIDSTLGILEGVIFLAAYAALIFFIERNPKADNLVKETAKPKKVKHRKNGFSWKISFGKLILGSILIFISSNIILTNTVKLGELLGVSTFVISLFVISIGTNLPEFTVGIRSILQHDKNLALGNYIGSAAVNTLLFGFLVLINPSGILINDSKIILTLSLLIVSLIIFFIFTVTKKVLSPKEGFVLLALYILFCVIEISGSVAK